MILYDNFDDARVKLHGTYVMYDGRAAYVKDVKPLGKIFVCHLVFINDPKTKVVQLDDPLFNYMCLQLGYVNYNNNAGWWCRVPQKQYQQGLNYKQCKVFYSDKNDYDFSPQLGWTESTAAMLENRYPDIQKVMNQLAAGQRRGAAFHRNFALMWDNIHQDFLIDYKGKSIGHLTKTKEFKLLDQYEHLTEAVKEAING